MKNNSNNTKNNEKILNNIDENIEKRNIGKVVVEYRKPSFFMSLLLILIGVCIATIFLVLLYMFKIEPKNSVENLSNENEETVNLEEDDEVKIPDVNLEIGSEDVKSLENKIPFDENFAINYFNRKVQQSSFSDENKLALAIKSLLIDGKYLIIENVNLGRVDKYDLEDVKNKYFQMFGVNNSFPQVNTEYNGYNIYYDETDKCFYGKNNDDTSKEFVSGRKIYSVEKNNDGKEIYIYEYFARVQLENQDKLYVFSQGDDYVEIKNETPLVNGIHINDEIFSNNEDIDFKKFKSTFKLDTNGNYYWYSTEPLN